MTYRRIASRKHRHLHPWTASRIRSASKDEIVARGKTSITVCMGGQTIQQEVAVVEGFPYQVLLGEDFLIDAKVNMFLHLGHVTMHCTGQQVPIVRSNVSIPEAAPLYAIEQVGH